MTQSKRVVQLADTIVRLLDQPARLKELEQFNFARAQQLFSLEAMVDAYRAMYSELLEQEPVQ